MSEAAMILSWVTGAASAAWVAFALLATYRIARMPRLEDQNVEIPKRLPRVSVLVPACNEEAKLEGAVLTLLSQDYPDLQVVLIDDRSSDATPEIVDNLARADARVVALHIDTLPNGWLGKTHALHRGVARADGEWLLLADADVEYGPGALQKIVALAETRGYEHVGLIPKVIRHTFAQDALVEAFGVTLVTQIPFHRLNESDKFFGVGAFNLVRRDFFDATEGFEWLRMEIADDMALGYLVKRNGGKTWAGTAEKTLQLDWYDSASDMIAGMEKNMFSAVAHYSAARAVAAIIALTLYLALPVLGLGLPSPWGWPLSLAALAAPCLVAVVASSRWGSNPLAVAAYPLGQVLLMVGMYRSMRSYQSVGGASWRGTVYPIDELKESQRVRL